MNGLDWVVFTELWHLGYVCADYVGICVFLFLVRLFLPLAGVMAAGQGLFFPYLVLLATGAGLIGALIPYGIGRFGGSPLLERIMKRFSSMEKPILTSYRVFGNHEKSAVLISRVIPLCPHLYRLCRGCHGAEYQPLSFVFCHRHCYMEHGINRTWLLFLPIQGFVLSLFWQIQACYFLYRYCPISNFRPQCY